MIFGMSNKICIYRWSSDNWKEKEKISGKYYKATVYKDAFNEGMKQRTKRFVDNIKLELQKSWLLYTSTEMTARVHTPGA